MIRKDHVHRAVYSFAVTTLAALFVPLGWAVVAVGLISAAKELYWDGLLRRGAPEWGDFVADVLGVSLACIVVGRWMG